jgi:hypothetical protein
MPINPDQTEQWISFFEEEVARLDDEISRREDSDFQPRRTLRVAINAQADDDSRAGSPAPHKPMSQREMKAAWEKLSPEKRDEILKPVVERIQERLRVSVFLGKELARTAELNGNDKGKSQQEAAEDAEHRKSDSPRRHGGAEEGEIQDAKCKGEQQQQIPRAARDDKALLVDRQEAVAAAESESEEVGLCEYVTAGGRLCEAEAEAEQGSAFPAEGGRNHVNFSPSQAVTALPRLCWRHADWVEMVEEEYGIPCPDDRESLKQALQRTMALVLSHKMVPQVAMLVVKICHTLERNMRRY